MSAVLRFATPEDVPCILEIYAPYIRETVISFEYEAPSLDDFRQRFDGITRRFPWLVCEEEGRLLGYAYASPYHERAAYQWDADLSVYLEPAAGRRKIATAFYHALFGLLRAQGYHNVYAAITAENSGSIAFHRALGFFDVGIHPRTGYKFGRWLDLCWMQKTLLPCEGEPLPTNPVDQLDRETTAQILTQAAALIKSAPAKI